MLARFATRAIVPRFTQIPRATRQMSGHSAEHAKKEVETWYKATIGTLFEIFMDHSNYWISMNINSSSFIIILHIKLYLKKQLNIICSFLCFFLLFQTAMIGVSTLFCAYNLIFHSHDHPRTDLPFMKIRNKPYPWSCPDCNLFDYACWNECKGGAKAEDSHH